MAVYKVIQDIEAQDKLVGPLTLKGFIYAAIAGLLAFINVRIFMASSLGVGRWIIIFILLAPILVFAILAIPIGGEQPTETWILSRLKFFLKPRVRIWDQSGIIELVTITAPKRIERQFTKGLSQSEVQSRLKALALTLDSRGWAVKNVAVNLGPPTGYGQGGGEDSDRLIAASSLQQDTPALDVHASDDIMDEQNNPTAKHFNELMKQADVERKATLIEKVTKTNDQEKGGEDVDFQFMFEGATALDGKNLTPVIVRPDAEGKRPGSRPEDDPYFQKRLGSAKSKFKSEHPGKDSLSAQKQKSPAVTKAEKSPEQRSTADGLADKLELAQSGNDLKVSSVAKLVNRKEPEIKQIGPNEIEIDLH